MEQTTLDITFPHQTNGYLGSCSTKFNSNDPWSTASDGETGKFDVQSVATHELGHWLVLSDLYDSDSTKKTMYGHTTIGDIKQRTLEPDDIAGIKYIYGVKPRVSSDNSIYDIELANDANKPISTDEPLDVHMGATIIKRTHEDLKKNSDIIITGKVKEILPSKWNTIDGEKPNKENAKPDQDCIIYTDIVITVDKCLKNPLLSKEVIVRTYGGKVGKDQIAGGHPNLKVGVCKGRPPLFLEN